ncbi:MAG: transglycosylase SLT domain-containing protein [Alphaproteobacteria bacterium]|nr:transglycosylase SLT domain-containing protein [Alphaproteobacteria bacterium]
MLRKILFILVISLVVTHPLKAQKEYKTNSSTFIKADDTELCSLVAARMEDKYAIKTHLLQTISSVETGLWDYNKEKFVSWPWTINVNGKGKHFKTKDEAVAEVKRLPAKGVKNIDVGCMQISLKYHANAFDSVEDAFEPEKNVEYSAKFLKKLYAKRKDWQKAAMDYHSKIPSKGVKYKKKLVKRFEKIKLAFLETSQNYTLF